MGGQSNTSQIYKKARMIKSDTLRDSSSTPRVLQPEESGWVQTPYIYIHIYIYTRIYWHYAACSNRTRGSLFNPTRAVYLCAHECLRYAMKGLSRRMRYNCTPNLSADSDASMKRTLRYPLFVCRVWEQIKYRILLDIFHSYIFSSPSRFENTRNIKLLDECIK